MKLYLLSCEGVQFLIKALSARDAVKWFRRELTDFVTSREYDLEIQEATPDVLMEKLPAACKIDPDTSM